MRPLGWLAAVAVVLASAVVKRSLERAHFVASSMAGTTLYTYPLAYAPFKAVLALHEKGVSYNSRYVDLFNGQSLSPTFLAKNPAGTVPVLEVVAEGGAASSSSKVITESREIVDWANSLPPGPLGSDGADQKLAESWVRKLVTWDGNLFIAANSDPGAAGLVASLQQFKVKFAAARAREHPELAEVYAAKIKAMQAADAQGKDPSAAEANRAQLVALLDEAEQTLAASPYLAGGAYSVADVVFTPLLFRLGMAGKTGEYLKPRPNVSGYYERMKQRPSFAAAFGPASSKLTLATTIVPALFKAKLAALTGRY